MISLKFLCWSLKFLLHDKEETKCSWFFLNVAVDKESAYVIYASNQEKNAVKIPTLIVIGEGDQVIVPSRSELLLPFFNQAQVVRHEGGHFVPATSKQKQAYLTFLDNQKWIKNQFWKLCKLYLNFQITMRLIYINGLQIWNLVLWWNSQVYE